jgi:hypothetical protein
VVSGSREEATEKHGRNTEKRKQRRLNMDSRVLKQIEEIYRQDAKFTERKKEKLQEVLGSLCGLSAIFASWR